MKKLKFLLCLLAITSLSNCKNPEASGDFVIVVGPTAVNALPLAQAKCTDTGTTTSLGEASVSFTLFKFSWLGKKQFIAQYAVLEIESNFLDKKYGGFITGTELNAAMDGHNIIAAGDSKTYQSNCGLRFGGLGFVDKGSDGFLSGVITIFGIEVDSDGNSSPVEAEAPVTINYAGKPGA